MQFVSLTRLRLRSVRFLPSFAIQTLRANRQARHAPGVLSIALLPDTARTFWTMTAWTDESAMRAYMLSGAHRRVMPKLATWCDEASVAHWTCERGALPSWGEADAIMRRIGRASKVRDPSAHHADLTFAPPRAMRRDEAANRDRT